jgi:hypothetical protein
MRFDKYENVLISSDAFEYTFTSEGPKGQFQKIIQFIETNESGIYNLAFGDLLEDGGVNDYVKNDNKDRDKILATVVYTVYEFTSRYPENSIFFAGSSPDRTRLYRMAISNNLTELSIDFEIFGVNFHDGYYHAEIFQKGKNILAFYVNEKSLILFCYNA